MLPYFVSLFIGRLVKDEIDDGKHGIHFNPDILELFILLSADDRALISNSSLIPTYHGML